MATDLADGPGEDCARRPSTVVELAGDQDLATAPALRERLAGLLAGGSHDVTLDLRAVTFFDTSALGAIVDAHRLGRAAGSTLTLSGVPPHVRRVLEITGLERVLDLR